MNEPVDREVALVAEAHRLPLEARVAYLQEACAGDSALRQRVEELLRLDQEAGDFLQRPAAGGQWSRPDLSPSNPMQNVAVGEKPGDWIGRYKLLERVGEGGCGVVYVAEQTEPVRRRVALKIIKLGMDTKAVVARFEAERQALALMEHPNIAKVFDAGSTDTGRPYFVMELVRGIKITRYCDQKNLPTNERLRLFIQVCQAIQHAHQKGIIHRDIKPSNILVTIIDGVPVPKVIDFGIAKATEGRLTEATVYTQLHQLIGTPAYMSPEQAEMTSVDVDTRSDIYSLGVLLYELLTGRTPFDTQELISEGIDAMSRHIREIEPLRPSTRLATLNPDELTTAANRRSLEAPRLISLLRGDLDWIVMKCLEKDRARRYATVNDLAADLQRHLNQQPVVARPPSTAYRVRKFIARNRAAVAGALALALVLVLGVFVSAWEARQAKADRLLARQEAYAADMNLAQQALAANDLGHAKRLLEAHRPQRGEPELRGWEWRYLWQACRSDALAELCRYSNSVFSVAYAPNGKVLAVAGHSFVDLWDVPGHRRIMRLQEGEGRALAFAPIRGLLAIGAQGQIRLWRIGPTNLVGEMPVTGAITRLKFSPEATRLASLDLSGEVTVWDVDHKTALCRTPGSDMRPAMFFFGGVDFSPDGKMLVVGDADREYRGQIRVFNVETGTTNFTISDAHAEPITAVAWSPKGDVIATGSGFSDGRIRLWDAFSGTPLGVLEGHISWVCRLIFSADGRHLYSASADQTIRSWDVAQRRPLARLKGSSDDVSALALSPDGTTLASGTQDGVVAFWNARPRREEDTLRLVPWDRQTWTDFSPDSQILAVVHEGTATLFDLTQARQIEMLPALGTNLHAVAYSPNGTLLVSGANDGLIRVWSRAEQRLVRRFENGPAMIIFLQFRADGARLFCVDNQSKASWWDTKTWQRVGLPFSVEGTYVGAVSPDGHLIAASVMGELRWFDGPTGKLLATASGHRQLAAGVAFSPDGLQVASAAEDGTVVLWDASTFKPVTRFKGHMHGAHGVAFSPDARRLVTGGSTSRDAVKVWDLATGRELITLSGKASLFRWVGFSPDGKWLEARGWTGGQVHLWQAPSWAEIEAVERGPAPRP